MRIYYWKDKALDIRLSKIKTRWHNKQYTIMIEKLVRLNPPVYCEGETYDWAMRWWKFYKFGFERKY